MMIQRFMLGNGEDALSISSYLFINNLVNKTEISDGLLRCTLPQNQGKILIKHDKYYKLTQVIISEGIPQKIIKDLEFIGEESRVRNNSKKYGEIQN